ncbi:MAG: alpha/beta fold hydrolase [Gemmatimonadales bacterium]
MRLLRFGFRVLQAGSPAAAAALAERLFFTPPRARLTPAMRAELERARPFTIVVEGHRVAGWSWGDGPVVYLVHGWGSRGGRLAAYVPPLVAAGFQVVAYDGIGHGASEGRLSSIPQLARTLRAMTAAVGPARGVVAHSLGASAATLAMEWGMPVARTVFVAPAADPVGYTLRWAELLGVRPDVLARLRAASERRLAFSWAVLDVPAMARRRSTPLLVIHDADDPVVPWSEGAAIAAAWPGSRLVTTNGCGHSEVARAPAVVAQGVEFLVGGATASAWKTALASQEGHRLEHELFYRERRLLRPVVPAV